MSLFTLRIGGGILRPAPGFTLFAVLGALFLLGLGCWQIQRMNWKHDLIAKIQTRMANEPIAYDTAASAPEEFDYHRVQITGVLHHKHELHLAARDARYSAYGYQVLTPLETADHRFVLVSRGWVPQEKKAPETRAEGQVAGEVTLSGIARLPQKRGWLMPENAPDRNVWLWVDLPAMAQAASVASFAPLLVEADAAPNPGGYPVGGQTRVNFPDNHAVYAITWFCLALALLVIWFVKFWEREPPKP